MLFVLDCLHLWDIKSEGPVVCIDADMQMYAPLGAEVIQCFHASGATFGSILDGMPMLSQQFVPGYEGIFPFGASPAPRRLLLILTPRPGVTAELVELARIHDGATICPATGDPRPLRCSARRLARPNLAHRDPVVVA